MKKIFEYVGPIEAALITCLLAVVSFFLVAFLCFPSKSRGQDCKDGQCFVKYTYEPDKSEKYEWYKHDDNHVYLYKGMTCVGQWVISESTYYPFDGVRNLEATKPPIDPPGHGAEALGAVQHWQLNGTKRKDRELTTYGGRPIHPGRITEAFNGTIEDDSKKGYLVIISKDVAKRESVLSDFHKLPKDFQDRYHVWMAPPDHFSMQDRFNNKQRFFTEGDPTVVLQESDGTVLFRRPQAEQKYKPSDMQDLLKSDPNYNPKLDPGLPTSTSYPTLSTPVATSLIISGAGVALLFWRKRK